MQAHIATEKKQRCVGASYLGLPQRIAMWQLEATVCNVYGVKTKGRHKTVAKSCPVIWALTHQPLSNVKRTGILLLNAFALRDLLAGSRTRVVVSGENQSRDCSPRAVANSDGRSSTTPRCTSARRTPSPRIASFA